MNWINFFERKTWKMLYKNMLNSNGLVKKTDYNTKTLENDNKIAVRFVQWLVLLLMQKLQKLNEVPKLF